MNWDPFRDIEEHIRRAFGGSGAPTSGRGFFSTCSGRWVPPMDLVETDTHFHLSADVPGMKREDMEVNVTDNRVCIRANRALPDAPEGAQAWAHCRERGLGPFERCFTLNTAIRDGTAKATYVDGVLNVVMEKVTPDASAPKPKNLNIS